MPPSQIPPSPPQNRRPNEGDFSRRGAKNALLRRRAFLLGLVLVVGGAFLGRQIERFEPTEAEIEALERQKRAQIPPRCDVLVVGGTPAGMAAAIAAARSGANVVLVEPREKLGGDITYAYLNQFDVPLKGLHQSESPVAYGVFGEFYRELGVAFDLKRAQNYFQRKIGAQKRIRLMLSTHVSGLQMKNGRLLGAILKSKSGKIRFWETGAVVDATNDAEIAAMAGAGYNIGRESMNPDRKMQSAGLLFSVSNVNWMKVRAYVRGQRAVSLRVLKRFKPGAANAIDVRVEGRRALLRLGGISGNYAWERGDIVRDYRARGPNVVMLSLNFGRQDDGSVVLNTLNLLNVNGLDAHSRAEARREGIAEIKPFLKHLRRNMPGFENAKLKSVAPEIYVRETRHIAGFDASTFPGFNAKLQTGTLTVSDIRESRAFANRVALCSYPLDLHPYERDDLRRQDGFGPERHFYTLPLGALIPRRADGVFVASRSLSATYSAAGSARVIPVTMAAGEAVGVAAWMCAKGGFSPHELVVSKTKIAALQKQLRKNGVNIGDDLARSYPKS